MLAAHGAEGSRWATVIPEVLVGPPRVLDEVGEQHELAARERIGLDADEPEQAGHGPFDLVAQRLGFGAPRQRRCLQRPDEVQRHARIRSRGVDRHLGRVAQRLDAGGVDALRREPLAPLGRGPRGQLVDGDAGRTRVLLVQPRLEVRGGELGEREQEVAHVALGVQDQRRDSGEQRLLEKHDAQAGLSRACHPDDDPVRGQVRRVDRERLGGVLTARRIRLEAELQIGHGPGV
jgi:hypothetical protein